MSEWSEMSTRGLLWQ